MKPEDLEPEKLYSGFGAPIRKEDKDEEIVMPISASRIS
jgi:hypothetical protein